MFLSHSSSIAPFADFQQKLCARHGVAPERYAEIALRQALYPHARLLRPVVRLFAPNFFAADDEFVAGLARLWRRRDFKIEAWDYLYHPANRGFFRRRLRLRISVTRAQRLVETLLGDPLPDEVVFLHAPDVDAAPQS